MEKITDNLFNSSVCSQSIVVADLLEEYKNEQDQDTTDSKLEQTNDE